MQYGILTLITERCNLSAEVVTLKLINFFILVCASLQAQTTPTTQKNPGISGGSITQGNLASKKGSPDTSLGKLFPNYKKEGDGFITQRENPKVGNCMKRNLPNETVPSLWVNGEYNMKACTIEDNATAYAPLCLPGTVDKNYLSILHLVRDFKRIHSAYRVTWKINKEEGDRYFLPIVKGIWFDLELK